MDDLPIYPVPHGTVLRGNWVPWHFRKVLKSRFVAHVEPAAGFHGILLWSEACDQDPPGTLPDDDVELARLAGLGQNLEGWRAVRDGALFEWTPCLCDIRGETVVRLQNPFVTEFVLDALGHMERKAREGKDGADRSLLSRLRRKMREAGAHAGLTEREEFVIAVQAALRAADVRWTVPNVRAAMDEVSMRTEAGGQLHNVVGALRMPGAAR